MAISTLAFFHWLKLKRYQYEVTFSLYMLTPTEKFVLNSVVFLVLSMIIIAATLYLPEHVMTIARRVYFYWGGEEGAATLQETAGAMAKTWSASDPTATDSVMDRLSDL